MQAFIDPASKIESIPELVEEDRPLSGLRISGTINPPMEAYFDKSNHRLVRIDWRKDLHRFSNWQDVEGSAYPAKCVGYRKAMKMSCVPFHIPRWTIHPTMPNNWLQ